MGSRTKRWTPVLVATLVFAAAATTTMLGGASANDGGTFTRSPASGAADAPIAVASVTACPEPPEPTAVGYHNDTELGLFADFFYDDAGPFTEIEADDAGNWSDDITLENAAPSPGTFMLGVRCGRYLTCNDDELPEGQGCLPRSDYAISYYEYVPQEYTVCEEGETTCDEAEATTTTTTTSTTTTSTSLPEVTTTTTTSSTTSTTAPPGTSTTSTSTTAAPGTTSTTAPALARRNPDGTASTSATTANPGGSLTVSGAGFMPGSTVTGIVFSTPAKVGSATANASGSVAMTVLLPSDLAAGTHELQLQGVNPQNQSRTLAANITVGLVRTGTDALQLLLLAFGLVAIGLALLRTRGQRDGAHFTR